MYSVCMDVYYNFPFYALISLVIVCIYLQFGKLKTSVYFKV